MLCVSGCRGVQVADAGELALPQAQLQALVAASAAGGPAAGLAADLALWREHLAAREGAKLGARCARLRPAAGSCPAAASALPAASAHRGTRRLQCGCKEWECGVPCSRCAAHTLSSPGRT